MMPDTSKVEMQVMIATLTVLTLLAICLYGLFSVSLTFSDNLRSVSCHAFACASMEVNDIIVVGDENRLFQLESREPICFRDMGLTASFGNGTRATANVTVTNTAVDAINETNAAETVTAAAVNAARPVEMNYRDGQLFVDGIPIDLPLVDLAMEDLVGVTTPVTTPQLDWNATGRATVDWFGAVPVAATEPTRPVRAQRAARPRAPRAEEPLNPGDTKMLDDFLGGFAIKETLQNA